MSTQDDPEASEIADDIGQAIAGGGTIATEVRKLQRYGIDADLIRRARSVYERRVGTIREMEDPNVLVANYEERGDWYPGVPDDATFWPPLRGRLSADMDQDSLDAVNRASDRVLSLMRPPGQDFATRGLVLGYVQSGKTTSFMSVMAKASDYGYRLFVVLSGITDNLRNQTQERLDEMLIGDLTNRYFKLTDANEDFINRGNAANLLSDPNQRLVAVVKKNPYRLRKLVEWINSAGEATLRTCPILIIDDEADQASIDVGKSRRSAINGAIIKLLQPPRSAYVAYSATPFANLLIEPTYDSLYPRDFIVDLPRSPDYFGPERIFGRASVDGGEDGTPTSDGLNVVREVPVDDFSAVQPPRGRGAVNGWDASVPQSLADALSWFVLATAARRVRRTGNKHSSMLIHTSMLAAAHERLSVAVSEFLNRLRDGVHAVGGPIIEALREQWESESPMIPSGADEIPVPWTEVEPHLLGVLDDCQVIVDNYLSDARLSYGKAPQTTIVIGGNTLSRGLTLEGLVSSYFVRASTAYDTLLQMGRWFGYRRGYSDLVRIWMPGELQDWFADLADVEEEIRADIRRYETEGENVTPMQLAVRIRQHPKMRITAAAKMRHAITVSTSYSRTRPQTILFHHRDAAWLRGNLDAGTNLLSGLTSLRPQRPLFKGVDVDRVLAFLRSYRFHERAKDLDPQLLTEYIGRQNEMGGLETWNIVVFEHPNDGNGTVDIGVGRPVNLIVRSRVDIPGIAHANIKSLVSTVDRVGDTGYTREELRRLTDVDEQGVDDADRPLTDSLLLAKVRVGEWDVPLLGLYPISKVSQANRNRERREGQRPRVALDAAEHVLGVCLFFPKALGKEEDSYVSSKLPPTNDVEIDELDQEIDNLDRADQKIGEDQEKAAEQVGPSAR